MWQELRRYRRRLPHWRLDGATYFVTWRLHRCQRSLRPGERTVVAAAISHFDSLSYDLAAYVVMDDHIHVLLTPHSGIQLENLVASWKSYTAHRLAAEHRRKAPIWQDEYHDRIIRSGREMRRKLTYIINNPCKRWPGIDVYRWLSVVGFDEGRATPSQAPRD